MPMDRYMHVVARTGVVLLQGSSKTGARTQVGPLTCVEAVTRKPRSEIGRSGSVRRVRLTSDRSESRNSVVF